MVSKRSSFFKFYFYFYYFVHVGLRKVFVAQMHLKHLHLEGCALKVSLSLISDTGCYIVCP